MRKGRWAMVQGEVLEEAKGSSETNRTVKPWVTITDFGRHVVCKQIVWQPLNVQNISYTAQAHNPAPLARTHTRTQTTIIRHNQASRWAKGRTTDNPSANDLISWSLWPHCWPNSIFVFSLNDLAQAPVRCLLQSDAPGMISFDTAWSREDSNVRFEIESDGTLKCLNCLYLTFGAENTNRFLCVGTTNTSHVFLFLFRIQTFVKASACSILGEWSTTSVHTLLPSFFLRARWQRLQIHCWTIWSVAVWKDNNLTVQSSMRSSLAIVILTVIEPKRSTNQLRGSNEYGHHVHLAHSQNALTHPPSPLRRSRATNFQTRLKN